VNVNVNVNVLFNTFMPDGMSSSLPASSLGVFPGLLLSYSSIFLVDLFVPKIKLRERERKRVADPAEHVTGKPPQRRLVMVTVTVTRL
jgi:hypothetical protein